MRALAAIALTLALAGCALPTEEPDLDLDSVPFTPHVSVHAFATGQPEEKTFRVTEDAERFSWRVEWEAATTGEACTALPDSPPRVRLYDPSGAERDTAEFTSPLVRGSEHCGMSPHEIELATIEGSWRVAFEGRGGVIATAASS